MPDSKALGGARDELSSLNKILDQICQIHSTPGKPANHTHRECWVFKQSGRLNAEHKGLDTPSKSDEPQKQHSRKQKTFPLEVKTVNMVHTTHTEFVAPKCNHWAACPITFNHRDRPTSIQHGGSAALVLNPIIDGYHLTQVLMDGGSDLNLLYQDTIRKMGINPTIIHHGNTSFQGVTLGPDTHCTGSLLLEVMFGSPDNFRSEKLIFDIAPFRSGYQALLGRADFARFNAVPHYASLKLKMPGPWGTIIVSGNIERSLRAEERAVALTANH